MTHRLYYLDANCLVKLLVDEQWSQELRQQFSKAQNVFGTTQFCLYEALGVLKAKWVGKTRPDSISHTQYTTACRELFSLVSEGSIQIEEVELFEMDAFNESERLGSQYGFDLSDAFQLITLQRGMLPKLKIGTVVLVSEDKKIRKAAKSLDLSAKAIDDM